MEEKPIKTFQMSPKRIFNSVIDFGLRFISSNFSQAKRFSIGLILTLAWPVNSVLRHKVQVFVTLAVCLGSCPALKTTYLCAKSKLVPANVLLEFLQTKLQSSYPGIYRVGTCPLMKTRPKC